MDQGQQDQQGSIGQQITAEELRNMTPEQIRALQKQNCIFCHIINGRVQSRKIYEDDSAVAILDINPANPGHVLLLPKEHYAIMPQMKEHDIGYLFVVAKAISNAMLRGLKCQGTNIFVANGVVAGQKAPHFMIHIIPRRDGDGMVVFKPEKKQWPEDELIRMQEKIQKMLAELYGIKKEKPLDLDKAEDSAEQESGKKEAGEAEEGAELEQEEREEQHRESGERERDTEKNDAEEHHTEKHDTGEHHTEKHDAEEHHTEKNDAEEHHTEKNDAEEHHTEKNDREEEKPGQDADLDSLARSLFGG